MYRLREAGQRHDSNVGDERLPGRSVFVEIDATHVVGQRCAADEGGRRAARRLGDPQHPTLLFGQLGTHPADLALKTFVVTHVREQAGHALRERPPAGPGEHQRGVVAGGAHHAELGVVGAQALLAHAVVDALRQGHRRELGARGGDQRRIFGHRRDDGPQRQQRIEVGAELAALLGAQFACQLRVPVVFDVLLQRGGVEALRVVQHQVGFERLVLRFGCVAALAQLLLDAQRQARLHGVYQHAVVGRVRRAVELAALEQAVAERLRHGPVSVQVGAGQTTRCFERGDDRQQVGRDAVGGGLNQRAHGVGARADIGHIAAVVGITDAPSGDRADAHQGHRGVAGDDQQRAAPFPLEVGAGQPAFGEHHVAQQLREEEALAAGLVRREHRVFKPIGAGDAAQGAIDRRALLRAADEVHAAQERIGVVRRGREHRIDELVERLVQAGELARERVDAGAPLRIPFGLKSVDQAVGQALLQELEFDVETARALACALANVLARNLAFRLARLWRFVEREGEPPG